MMTPVNDFFSKLFVHEKEISGDDIPCIHSVSVVGLVDLLGSCVSCSGGYRGSGKSCRCGSRATN